MNNVIYKGIGNVILSNRENSIDIGCLYSFEDYCNEIVVVSAESIDNLNRGWVGDLLYQTHCGIDAKTGDRVNHVSYRGFKDVLLARINVSSEVGEPIKWTYTFLKD